jgi:hypothetical protein
MSESDDERLDRAFRDLPLVSGPSIVMRDPETGRRTRPAPGRLDRFPRSVRVAEIICHRTRQQPTLPALVVGSKRFWHVVLSEPIGGGPVDQDYLAPCRCGLDHVIDGGKLRSALLALPDGKSGATPRIDVAIIERSNAGPRALE